jgi:DNA repair exonuclease SbcCD nuclease subunit
MNKLKKAAMFTDIHLGRRNNSEEHNTDCVNYVDWFCEQVKKDKSIDHIYFLGDWYEHRSSINGLTLQYSNRCAKKLNSLGLPIYFIVGNHDLHNRNNRDVFNTEIFEHLSNFNVINDITVLTNVHNSVLLIPYIYENENAELLKHEKVPVALGHLDLAGFILTGEHSISTHGLDHKKFFKKQKRVFSGHFHKRQEADNIHYIGNTFPMDFSDANDNARGMAIYNFETNALEFIDWPDCPKYITCKLSDALEDGDILLSGARVRCTVDVEISYSESIELRNILIESYKLRELFFNETQEKQEVLENTELNEEQLDTQSTHELIKSMLMQIVSEKMDKELLVKIYEGLK